MESFKLKSHWRPKAFLLFFFISKLTFLFGVLSCPLYAAVWTAPCSFVLCLRRTLSDLTESWNMAVNSVVKHRRYSSQKAYCWKHKISNTLCLYSLKVHFFLADISIIPDFQSLILDVIWYTIKITFCSVFLFSLISWHARFNWVQYFVSNMENVMMSCVGSLMDVFLFEFLGLLALLFFWTF